MCEPQGVREPGARTGRRKPLRSLGAEDGVRRDKGLMLESLRFPPASGRGPHVT